MLSLAGTALKCKVADAAYGDSTCLIFMLRSIMSEIGITWWVQDNQNISFDHSDEEGGCELHGTTVSVYD